MNLKEYITEAQFKNKTRVKSIQPIGLVNGKPKVKVGTLGTVKNKVFPLKKHGSIIVDFDDIGEIQFKYNPDDPAVKAV